MAILSELWYSSLVKIDNRQYVRLLGLFTLFLFLTNDLGLLSISEDKFSY